MPAQPSATGADHQVNDMATGSHLPMVARLPPEVAAEIVLAAGQRGDEGKRDALMLASTCKACRQVFTPEVFRYDNNSGRFQAMWAACCDNDLTTLRWVLENGPAQLINQRINMAWSRAKKTTPLIMATYYGSPNVLQELLRRGADANLAAFTPEKADPQVNPSPRRKPLHMALSYWLYTEGVKDSDIVRSLLTHGADPNGLIDARAAVHIGSAYFPLCMAMDINLSAGVVHALLEYGADPSMRTPDTIYMRRDPDMPRQPGDTDEIETSAMVTPLERLFLCHANEGNDQIEHISRKLQLLMERVPVEKRRDVVLSEALSRVGEAMCENDEAMRTWGAHGLDFDATKYGEQTVLQRLVQRALGRDGENLDLENERRISQDVEAIKRLLRAGANPNYIPPGTGQDTPMVAVCRASHARWNALVRLLLQSKGNPNARGEGENMPLHYATDAERIQDLVGAGADVNACNERGETPLHLLVGAVSADRKKHRRRAVGVLLEHHANPRLRDLQGRTVGERVVDDPMLRTMIREASVGQWHSSGR